jgi:hypothetical protein
VDIDENTPNAVAVRPSPRSQGSLDYWFQPLSVSPPAPATILDRDFFNDLLANIRAIRDLAGGSKHTRGSGGDSDLFDWLSLTLGQPTGSLIFGLWTTAPPGYVLFDDKSIGDASSGATGRANADTEDLFTLLWTNCAEADAPVSGGGRGASAAADFSAHKTLTLPVALGRAIAVAGSGSGLTARALGHAVGEEAHALTSAENGPHAHGLNLFTSSTTSGANENIVNGGGASTNTASSGSGTPHNTMQPTVFVTAAIKL